MSVPKGQFSLQLTCCTKERKASISGAYWSDESFAVIYEKIERQKLNNILYFLNIIFEFSKPNLLVEYSSRESFSSHELGLLFSMH